MLKKNSVRCQVSLLRPSVYLRHVDSTNYSFEQSVKLRGRKMSIAKPKTSVSWRGTRNFQNFSGSRPTSWKFKKVQGKLLHHCISITEKFHRRSAPRWVLYFLYKIRSYNHKFWKISGSQDYQKTRENVGIVSSQSNR